MKDENLNLNALYAQKHSTPDKVSLEFQQLLCHERLYNCKLCQFVAVSSRALKSRVRTLHDNHGPACNDTKEFSVPDEQTAGRYSLSHATPIIALERVCLRII